jgi:hypothetical protein
LADLPCHRVRRALQLLPRELPATTRRVSLEIDTRHLVEHFHESHSTFANSPLYQAYCCVVPDEPSLLALLMGRRQGQQPSFLLFGAIHFILLAGETHPLSDFYPDLGGARPADPEEVRPVLRDFCRRYRDELSRLVTTRLVQSNVVQRAFALRMLLHAVRGHCHVPVHLIEVGASAGIHLRFDDYRYEIGGRVFGKADSRVAISTLWLSDKPPPDLDDIAQVKSRVGVDLAPIDTAREEDRLWLRALVWPEATHEARLLASALECVAQNPPRVVSGDAIDVLPELAASLPLGEPRVVFHAATRMHVPADRRCAFDAAIDALNREGPLYHGWLEPGWAQHADFPSLAAEALAFHGPDENVGHLLVRIGGHGEWMAPIEHAL